MSDLHERDFYAWTNRQACLLRMRAEGKMVNEAEVDWANVAEEIESLGNSEKRELVSRLTGLFLHLLKWQYQPDRRGNSWRLSIVLARDEIGGHLSDNPSLKSDDNLPAAMVTAYRRGRIKAAQETELPESTFPPECPWSFEQAMRDDFWPAP